MWSLASPRWSSLQVAVPGFGVEAVLDIHINQSPIALLTKKLLTASLHSAGPLLGLATYLDTSTQLPWPVVGKVSTFRFHQIIVINFTEGSLTKLFNAIKQLHQLLASPIAEKG